MNRTLALPLLISSALILPLSAMAQVENVSIDPETALASQADSPAPTPMTRTVSLQSIQAGRRIMTLDWRRPEQVLRFDLSPTDRIETLRLKLSGERLPDSEGAPPLQIVFNGSEALSLNPSDSPFTHELILDRKRARVTGNELRLRFPSGCDDPQTAHARAGGFAVDLTQSEISLASVQNGQALTIEDLEPRFSNTVFAPKTVGLISDGPMGTRFQGLAAQGLALHMDDIPQFVTRNDQTGATDFDIIMATRTELSRRDDLSIMSDDAAVLSGTGPALILSAVHPDRLYITGDTADDVLQAVNAFATASLPRTETRSVTPADILVQSPLDYDRRRVNGVVRLSSLSVQSGEDREYAFDVADPEAMKGSLVLHLNRDGRTAPGSKLVATLNGAELGRATLNGRRMTASYPIRPGLLVGSDNRLILKTVDGRDAPQCGASDPFIAIGNGSELRLGLSAATSDADLSRLAANGSFFSAQNGADTVLILPEQDEDFAQALQLVAQLAKASGRGWTSARFARGGTDDQSRHQLVIEPYYDLDLAYKGAAPQAMKAAWRGEPVEGRNRVAAYARLNGQDAPAVGRINQGGVAAIFPLDDSRMVGLITNTPGTDFGDTIAPLSTSLAWNGLAGGVSRWSGPAVVTTQQPLDMIEHPSVTDSLDDPSPLPKQAATDSLTIPALNLPELTLSDAGDWLHRQWRENSQEQIARKAHQAEKAERRRAQAAKAAEARTSHPNYDGNHADNESKTARQTNGTRPDFKARMDGGLFSKLDLWTQGSKNGHRGDELHPATLILFLMLLGGLLALVIRRARTPKNSRA